MSSKNSLNQYGEDFLSAKTLPWSLRQYIISYGGVEKLRTEVWGRYWGEEFVKQKEQGKSERRARKLAQEHCQGIVLEMACTAGFLERKPRAEKKETDKKRRETVTPEQNTEVTRTKSNQISLSEPPSQISNTTEIQNIASLVAKPDQEKRIVSTLELLHGKFSAASLCIYSSGLSTAIKFSSPVAIVEFFEKLHISDTEASKSSKNVFLANVAKVLSFSSLSPSSLCAAHHAGRNAYIDRKKGDAASEEIVENAYRRINDTNGKTMAGEAMMERDAIQERVPTKILSKRWKKQDQNESERNECQDENEPGIYGGNDENDTGTDDNKHEYYIDRHKSHTGRDERKDESHTERDERKDEGHTERDESKDKSHTERYERKDESHTDRCESKDERGTKGDESKDETYDENEAERDEHKQANNSEGEEGKGINVVRGIRSRNESKRDNSTNECIVEKEESEEAVIDQSSIVSKKYSIKKVDRKKKSFGRRFRSGISRFFHRLCVCRGHKPNGDI